MHAPTYRGVVDRVLGSWMSGPRAARDADDDLPKWRGQRLGLPESGPGAVAPPSRRALAFFIDIALAALIALPFTAPELPRSWSLLAWAMITVVPVSIFGFTPGMAAMRIWVARADGNVLVGVPRAVLRCVLTALLVPAVLWNLDGRSWHDRLSQTVVLRR